MQEVPNSAPEHEPIPPKISPQSHLLLQKAGHHGRALLVKHLGQNFQARQDLIHLTRGDIRSEELPTLIQVQGRVFFSFQHEDTRIQVRKNQEAMNGSLFRARGQKSGHLCSKGEQVRTGQRSWDWMSQVPV